jgi:hypothetical protein
MLPNVCKGPDGLTAKMPFTIFGTITGLLFNKPYDDPPLSFLKIPHVGGLWGVLVGFRGFWWVTRKLLPKNQFQKSLTGYVWLCLVVFGCVWLCSVVFGCVWLFPLRFLHYY